MCLGPIRTRISIYALSIITVAEKVTEIHDNPALFWKRRVGAAETVSVSKYACPLHHRFIMTRQAKKIIAQPLPAMCNR